MSCYILWSLLLHEATRLVNCYRIYYTLAIKSLLTDTSTLLYDYASNGAILLKSVEENTQEGQGLVLLCTINKRCNMLPLLLQMNKMGEVLPLTVTNE